MRKEGRREGMRKEGREEGEERKKNVCMLCSLMCQCPRAFHNVEAGFQVSNVN